MLALGSALVALHALAVVNAFPAATKRQGITTLNTTQIESFKPYTWYSAASHCNSSTTANWTCGLNCEANPLFEPVAAGGDGDTIQFCESNITLFVPIQSVLIIISRVRWLRSNTGDRDRIPPRNQHKRNVRTTSHIEPTGPSLNLLPLTARLS